MDWNKLAERLIPDEQVKPLEYYEELYHQTMQFIKRQRTWYRKEDPTLTHYLTDPGSYLSQASQLITDFLK